MIVVESLSTTTLRARPELRQGDVLEHALAPIAEARSLHRDSLEGATQLVDHDRRERLALDILSHDQQRTATGSPCRTACPR